MWSGFEFFEEFSLLYGPPGAGKTSLALYAAFKLGERVLYAGFYETGEAVVSKARALGLDVGRLTVLDFFAVSDADVLYSTLVSKYVEVKPDVAILDGINALPQSREAAASIYRIFRGPVIAIGEESVGGSHFAYYADSLVEVRQVFHRGARYRLLRVVKTRLSPSRGAEYFFTISRRGVHLLRKWSQGSLGGKLAGAPSGRRATFSEEVVKALVGRAPAYTRPGLLAGSRVGVFLEDHPTPLRLAAAFLCDYLDEAKVGVVSTYPLMGSLARQVGCSVEEVVVPAAALDDDAALHEALDKVGDVSVVVLYGLEEVLARYGARRVGYVMDFFQTFLPDSAVLATFRGVEPTRELLGMFNTAWRYYPDHAVVVKSALGWPVRELRVVERDGRFYLG